MGSPAGRLAEDYRDDARRRQLPVVICDVNRSGDASIESNLWWSEDSEIGGLTAEEQAQIAEQVRQTAGKVAQVEADRISVSALDINKAVPCAALLAKLLQPAHARAKAVWDRRDEEERQRREEQRRQWAIEMEEWRRKREEQAAERQRKWEEEHPELVAAEAERQRKRVEQERLDRIWKPHRFEYSNDYDMPTPWVRNNRNGVQALSTRNGLLVVTPADPLDLDQGWTVTKHRDGRPEPRVVIKGVSQERAFEVADAHAEQEDPKLLYSYSGDPFMWAGRMATSGRNSRDGGNAGSKSESCIQICHGE